MRASLEVELGGQVIQCDGSAEVRVGRDPTCLVTVADARVSRHHATLRPAPSGWLWDDHSSSGTWHQGTRLGQFAIDAELTVRLGDPHSGPELRLRPVPTPPAVPQPPPATAAIDDRLGGVLRSQPAGPSLVMSRPAQQRIRVGRAPDNDVVLDDLTVSRHHAELRPGPAGFELVDLGSGAGTFLNGTRVTRAVVPEGSLVAIGRHFFVFSAGRLDQYVDDAAALVVRDLCFTLPEGRRLVDNITFALEPGQLLAVLGTTGAGKSTLLRALTGFVPATSGQVAYNGRDLYRSIDELRYRIGYVPQDDILHSGLRLRQALQFAAELRFSDDTSPPERAARVDEVLGELGLAHRADLPIARLSGGQRKRASVAVELLSRPSLLFLDEPTSGLDPGFERSVMELLRQLADGGRTVVVITHSVASLELCDRVLFLAPGGRMAYYGPPAGALGYFANADFPEVFKRLEFEPREWSAEFRAHPAHDRYVAEPVRRALPCTGPAHPPRAAAASRRGAGVYRQLRTLIQRNVAVLAGNRANAALLLAQAPIMALLLLAALQVGNLRGLSDEGEFRGDPRTLLMVLVLAAVAMGLINSVREVVKELEIYRRERTVGLSLTAYLGSKFLCLAAIAAAQSAVLSLLVVVPQGGSPGYSFTLGLIVFLTALSTVALGLAISALVSTDSAATVLIPVLIVAQLIFSNAVLEVEGKPVLGQATWLSQSYWGYAAAASAVNLREIDRPCAIEIRSGGAAPRGGGRAAPCSSLWKPGPGYYLLGIGGLLVLGAAGAGASVFALRRRDPLRGSR